MIAPRIGIYEDPFNGSGLGLLGAYLLKHGLVAVSDDRASFLSSPGRAMGRAGMDRVKTQLRAG